MQDQDISAVKDLFQKAAFETGTWSVALDQLASVTRSSMSQLVGFGNSHAVQFNLVPHCPEGALVDFVRIDGASPEVNWRVAAAQPITTMKTVWEPDYERERTELARDTYDDYCAHYDIPFGCHTSLVASDQLMVGLALLRGRRDGPTTEAIRSVFSDIAPHARLAVETAIMLEHEGSKIVGGALETMSAMAFVSDSNGFVQAMTLSAERVLRSDPPFGIRARRLFGKSKIDEDLIEQALGAALALPGHFGPASIVIGKPDRPMIMSFVALPRKEWSFGFEPRILTLIKTAASNESIAPHLLNAVHGLTLAESAVVNAFLSGCSRVQIARERGVSLGTVQSQLKTIYRKTGTSREADLASKLAWLNSAIK